MQAPPALQPATTSSKAAPQTSPSSAPQAIPYLVRCPSCPKPQTHMRLPITFLLAILTTVAVSAQSAIGTWITVDDNTGEDRSHIEIYEKGGKLYGKITLTIDDDGETNCTTCTGGRANAPYIGMEIISAAAPDGDKEWEGKIYDPESDTTYKLVMWLEDNTDVLYVRGKHWTGLYRTQTWKRK